MQLAIVIPISELGGGIQLPGQLPGGSPGYPTPGPTPPQPGGPSGGQLPSPPVSHLPPQHGQLPVYPETPGHPLPPPGVVWPPLGPSVPSGKALAVIFISGFGYRWTVIDTSLVVSNPMPTPTGAPLTT